MNLDQYKSLFIDTVSNKKLNFLNPQSESICIEDIAHSLSYICRFNGHCEQYYSVAQHSIFVSDMLPDHLKIYGLLHDAPEAYINDIPRPLKKLINGSMEGMLKKIEYSIHQCIDSAFNLPEITAIDANLIKLIDNSVLFVEAHTLKPNSDFDEWTFGEMLNPNEFKKIKDHKHLYLKNQQPTFVKEYFLTKFNYLLTYKQLNERKESGKLES